MTRWAAENLTSAPKHRPRTRAHHQERRGATAAGHPPRRARADRWGTGVLDTGSQADAISAAWVTAIIGSLPLGVALLFAAIAGALLVALAGTARIL